MESYDKLCFPHSVTFPKRLNTLLSTELSANPVLSAATVRAVPGAEGAQKNPGDLHSLFPLFLLSFLIYKVIPQKEPKKGYPLYGIIHATVLEMRVQTDRMWFNSFQVQEGGRLRSDLYSV